MSKPVVSNLLAGIHAAQLADLIPIEHGPSLAGLILFPSGRAPTHWMDDRGYVVTDEFLKSNRSTSDWREAYYIPCMLKPPKDRGQGRKPLSNTEETVIVSVRMTPSLKAKLDQLGGSAWIREKIQKARPKVEIVA